MFLIRTLFWLSLVVLLLPSDPDQQERLYKTAASAATQASTFCDRNADVCDKGVAYWAAFRKKLDFGARMAMDIASERLLGTPRAREPMPHTVGTLAPADREPAWRGRQKVGA